MKRFLLTLLVSMLLLTAFISTSAEEIGENSFSRFCPADTPVYLEFPSIRALCEKLPETAFAKTLVSKALSDLLQGEREIERIKAICDLCRIVGQNVKKFEGAIGGRASAFMQKTGEEYIPVIAIDVPKVGEDAAKALFAAMSQIIESLIQVNDRFQIGIKVEEYSSRGGKGVHVFVEDDPVESELFAVHKDGFIVVSFTEEALTKTLDRMEMPPEQSLYANRAFVKCMKAMEGKDLLSYINPSYLTTILKETPTAFISELINQFESIGSSATFEGLNTLEEYIVMAKSATTMPFSLDLTRRSLLLKNLKMFPKDAMLYGAFNLPSTEVLVAALKEIDDMNDFERDIKEAFEVSFYDEIVPTLGTEVGGYMNFTGAMPEFVLTFELRNANALRNKLDLIAIRNMGIRKQGEGDREMYQFTPISEIPVFGVIRENMFCFGTLLALKSAFSRKQENSLVENEAFRRVYEKTARGDANLFLYADSLAFARFGLTMLQTQNPDLDTVGLFDLAEDLLSPIGIAARISGERLIFRTETPAHTTLAAAIVIPSLINSRRSRNELYGMSITKMFGTAAMDFSNTTAEGFFWESDTQAEGFEPYFWLPFETGGYRFKYFSNDTNHDGKHEATKFVYLAYPVSMDRGHRAFCVNESMSLWTTYITEDMIKKFDNFKESDIDWEIDGTEKSRCEGDFAEFFRL